MNISLIFVSVHDNNQLHLQQQCHQLQAVINKVHISYNTPSSTPHAQREVDRSTWSATRESYTLDTLVSDHILIYVHKARLS